MPQNGYLAIAGDAASWFDFRKISVAETLGVTVDDSLMPAFVAVRVVGKQFKSPGKMKQRTVFDVQHAPTAVDDL
jgi:hypothetical protein